MKSRRVQKTVGPRVISIKKTFEIISVDEKMLEVQGL
jgi:hypothetical protein